MQKDSPKKIPILDIPGLGAFQMLGGNEPEMEINGTRATLMFNVSDLFYELSERFNNNELVPVLDFLNIQRQLKARMLSLKSQASQETNKAGGRK